jgi:Glycosyl hydrolase family 71
VNGRQMGGVGRAALTTGSYSRVRHAVAVSAHALVLSMAASTAQCADGITSAQWVALQANAQSLVDAQSPLSSWPFAINAALRGPGHRPYVFAHYFTPFPLSFDNLPAPSDYYCAQYLRPSGEGNKFLKVGGFLRDRPLSLPPYDVHVYKERALAVEILRARSIGIDGFGVDLMQLNQGEQWNDVMRLYSVAEHVAPNFTVLVEPDMSALADASVEDMVAAIRAIAGKKSAFRTADGNLAVAPFYAENVRPGYWSDVIHQAAVAGVNVTLIPIFLDPSRADDFRAITNTFSFWGVRTPSESTEKGGWEDQALTTIESFGADVMIPVAPQDARPKDSTFWEALNSALFRDQWSQVLSRNPAYVQIVTWNDYSESTHVAPSVGTQFAFYDLAAYYIEWAKSGAPPPITQDSIIYFHRRQLFSPGRSSTPETPMTKMGEGPIANEIEMVGFLTAPATMQISVNGAEYTSRATAGLNVFRVPAAPGAPTFSIVRDGIAVAHVTSATPIVAVGSVQDPLYVGGASARPPVSLECNR